MKDIIYILFFLSSTVLFSQSLDEVLKKVEDKYSTQGNFKVGMRYKLFKGATSDVIVEEYKGLLIIKDKSMYTKINNTEMISTKAFYIKVNHDEKAMIYDLTSNENSIEQQINLELLLDLFDKGKIKDNGAEWECELVAKMFSQVPYSKVILVIKKEDYSLSKQIFYYSSLIDFSKKRGTEDFDIARLEIEYNNILKVSSLDDPFFNKNNYVKVINNKIIPIGKYKSYEIINTKL